MRNPGVEGSRASSPLAFLNPRDVHCILAEHIKLVILENVASGADKRSRVWFHRPGREILKQKNRNKRVFIPRNTKEDIFQETHRCFRTAKEVPECEPAGWSVVRRTFQRSEEAIQPRYEWCVRKRARTAPPQEFPEYIVIQRVESSVWQDFMKQ